MRCAARRRRAWALGPRPFLLDRVAADSPSGSMRCWGNLPSQSYLGTPSDAVRRALVNKKNIGMLVRPARRTRKSRRIADEEALRSAMPRSISSSRRSRCQFVNDLPAAHSDSPRAECPTGSSRRDARRRTLTELRQAFAEAETEVEGRLSPHVAPFADVRELGALLQRAGFALPVTDVDRLTVR